VNVVVVGAGKMGLPLAVQIADRGGQVTACDINPTVVDLINSGVSPIDEPGVPEILGRVVRAGSLSATTDTVSAAAKADVVIVIVPAVLTDERDIDSSILESVAHSISGVIPKGALVSFETTMPVGGTRARLLPALEAAGKRCGVDFDLVFSPERVKSQSVMRNLTVNPKVVGGFTTEAAARAEAFYATYLGAPIYNVGTLEAAEFVKLAGMVYRDVNIALANELAGYAETIGVDLPSLRTAINSDGEAALLSPGIGVGGHCTPVYPYFLIRDAERRGVSVPMAIQSRRRNDSQAAHALDQLERIWGPVAGKTVNVLGLAFRPQVKEHIFSTVFLLEDELRRRGATALVTDPLYEDDEIRHHGFTPGRLDSPAEVLILNTAHDAFADLEWEALASRGVRAVVDGRNAWPTERIRSAGIMSIGIGVPLPQERIERFLPVARPVLADREAEAAATVVRSGWIMQGPEVAAFEAEFAEALETPHAVAVSSGTAALHLALHAAGVRSGDEVITVSHSHISTANSVTYVGAVPVFVDIDGATFNIDPAKVEEAITDRTRAILVVHQFGMPADLSRLLPIARRHGLLVIEDAACAAGSAVDLGAGWEPIGRPHGDLATFSFHPRKILTTGDGGMVTTASDELARAVRQLRQHGTLDGRTHPVIGFNYRLTDVQAAIGRSQLQRLPGLVEERRFIAGLYAAQLTGLNGVRPPTEPAGVRTNWQSYAIRLPHGTDTASVVDRLATHRIGAKTGIVNAHTQAAYAAYAVRHPLAESEAAERDTIVLPLVAGMREDDVARVVSTIQDVLRAVQA